MSRRTRLVQPRTKRRRFPVEVVKADPGCWRDALAIAHGDVRRLRVEPDGTVVVVNRPRKSDPNGAQPR
jgi:hypothetical protein